MKYIRISMIVVNPTPLKGIVLAGYAKANADAGVTVAAQKCGYGNDIERFVAALQSTCMTMSIEDRTLSKLMTEQCQIRELHPVKPIKYEKTGA